MKLAQSREFKITYKDAVRGKNNVIFVNPVTYLMKITRSCNPLTIITLTIRHRRQKNLIIKSHYHYYR